ncbi:MAG: recombinase family protein [Xenophilus sp.]
MLVGYARVSTVEQDTRLQRDALRAAGVRRVYEEKGSGVGPRPELHRALDALSPGDVLVVWKLDRFARSVRHLWEVLDRIRAAGAGFRSLTEPVDTSSPLGEFVLSVLGAVSQFERALIRERCEAGRRAAMARGVKFGRSPLVVGEGAQAAADLYAAGATVAEIAAMFGVSDVAIRRALREAGAKMRGRAGAVQRGPMPLVAGEEAAKAVKMYLSGNSIDQTARAFGVSPSAMRRTLLREGITFRARV